MPLPEGTSDVVSNGARLSIEEWNRFREHLETVQEHTDPNPVPIPAQARIVFSIAILKDDATAITPGQMRFHVQRGTPTEPHQQLVIAVAHILDGSREALVRQVVRELVEIVERYRELNPDF